MSRANSIWNLTKKKNIIKFRFDKKKKEKREYEDIDKVDLGHFKDPKVWYFKWAILK